MIMIIIIYIQAQKLESLDLLGQKSLSLSLSNTGHTVHNLQQGAKLLSETLNPFWMSNYGLLQEGPFTLTPSY